MSWVLYKKDDPYYKLSSEEWWVAHKHSGSFQRVTEHVELCFFMTTDHVLVSRYSSLPSDHPDRLDDDIWDQEDIKLSYEEFLLNGINHYRPERWQFLNPQVFRDVTDEEKKILDAYFDSCNRVLKEEMEEYL